MKEVEGSGQGRSTAQSESKRRQLVIKGGGGVLSRSEGDSEVPNNYVIYTPASSRC